MLVNKLKILSSTVVALTVFAGCGGGSSSTASSASSESLMISGTISGDSYVSNDFLSRFLRGVFTPAYAIGLNDADKIVVMYNGGRDWDEFPINSDGSFAIDTSLFDYDDLVVLVVNSVSKRVYGHLNLAANNSEKLDFVHKSSLQSSLNLGTISASNNFQTTTSLQGTTAFKASELDNLQLIARSDDSLQLYANNWRNENIASYMAIVFNSGTLSSITDNFNAIPSNISSILTGYHPLFYLDNTSSVTSVDLYPPANINHGLTTGLGTAGATTLNLSATSTTPISNLTVFSGGPVKTIETAYIDNTFPSGDWILKNHSDSSVIGKFEFAAAKPFDLNGHFKGVIPSLKIVTSNNGTTLNNIVVKLYSQNANGDNFQLTRAQFGKIINVNDDIVFSYVLNGQNVSQNFSLDETASNETQLVFTSSSSIQINDLSRLIFSYYLGQSKYQFFIQ